jgi:hypothetical protein
MRCDMLVVLLATLACGDGADQPRPAAPVTPTTTAPTPPTVIPPAPTAPPPAPRPSLGKPIELATRTFTGRYHAGARPISVSVWIERGREPSINTKDPCCAVSYDGNRYLDRLATCAAAAPPGAEDCGREKQAVYPGLADDRVCGERRRCVPMPAVRIVVLDDTAVTAVDSAERPLARGTDPAVVLYAPVSIDREGFVVVQMKKAATEQSEKIAADYGSHYTIYVRGGRVERVTRDPSK